MNGCDIDDEDAKELSVTVRGKTIDYVSIGDVMRDTMMIHFTDGTRLDLTADWFYEWALVQSAQNGGGKGIT